MSVIAILVVAQYVFVAQQNACERARVGVARSAGEAFLDPSLENRTRLTEMISDRLTATDVAECEGVLDSLQSFAVAESLPVSLRSLVDSRTKQEFGYTRTTGARRRQSQAEEARSQCKSERVDACSAELLRGAVLLDFESIAKIGSTNWVRLQPVLAGDADLSAWLSLRRQYPGRASFLRVAAQSPNPLIRAWAIDEAVGAPDPREWRPEDVAALVLAARDAREEARRIDNYRLQGLQGSHLSPPQSRESVVRIRVALGRMGFDRVYRLIAGGDALPHEPRSGPPWDSHFPGEESLCVSDLLAQQGGQDATGLSAEQRSQLIENCNRRWSEIDEAAPHPDLKAVRSILERKPEDP